MGKQMRNAILDFLYRLAWGKIYTSTISLYCSNCCTYSRPDRVLATLSTSIAQFGSVNIIYLFLRFLVVGHTSFLIFSFTIMRTSFFPNVGVPTFHWTYTTFIKTNLTNLLTKKQKNAKKK